MASSSKTDKFLFWKLHTWNTLIGIQTNGCKPIVFESTQERTGAATDRMCVLRNGLGFYWIKFGKEKPRHSAAGVWATVGTLLPGDLLCRRTPRVRWEQSRGISIATGFCCDEACCSCVLRVSSVQIHGAATAHALYSQYTYTKHIGWHSTAQYTCTCTVLIIVTGHLKQEISNARTLITVNNG